MAKVEWERVVLGLVLSAVAVSAVAAGAPAVPGHGADAGVDGTPPAGATPADRPGADGSATQAGGDPPGEADAVIRDGSTHFVGQVLYTEAFSPGDDVDLEQADGTFVTDVVLRPDGSVLLDSSDVPPGNYVLTDDAGTSLSFTLALQEYRITPARPFVRNGGNESELVLSVDSNRDGYTHLISSPDLDPSAVRRLFGVGRVADADGDGTREVVVGGGTTAQEFTADFDGVPVGNYTFRFEVPDTRARATVEVRVGVYPPGEVTIEGDEPLRVQQTSGEFVGGTTSLPEGTMLRITVTNDDGQPFRRSAEVRVREGGSYGARFDFSGVPEGQSFTVTVRLGETARARTEGVVVAPATLLVSPSQTVDGRTVTVDTAVLPNGGFVAVSTQDGDLLGVTAYLDPGTHRDVAVPLAEPLDPGTTELSVAIHRDTDGDRRFEFSGNATVDVRYRRVGVPVEKSTEVTVPGATPSPTATPTATATASPTASPTATATASATPEPTETTVETVSDGAEGDGGPGFGAGAALVAVLALAAILALRRRDQ